MGLFITLSKKNLAVITALVIIFFLVLGSVYSAESGKIDGSTNALRVAYIKRLGYEVDETAVSVKEITVPMEFSAVYEKYNQLQKKAGFDLADFRGEKAEVYCYKLSFSDEKAVNLIVSDGVIIGGDIAETRIDGEMKPLLRKNDV